MRGWLRGVLTRAPPSAALRANKPVRLRASLLLTLRGLAFFTDRRRIGDVRTTAGAERVFGDDSLLTLRWTEADRVTIYYTQGKLHARLE